jgi:hypothetical protein
MGFTPSGSVQDGSITKAKLATALSANYDAAARLAADALVVAIIAGATTGYVPDKAKGDAFTAAAGHESTVDTGAGTTAVYASSAYANNAPETCTSPQTPNSQATNTTKTGWKIYTKKSFSSLAITKSTSSTATTAYILDAAKSVLASAAFSGSLATITYAGANSTTYYVVTDSGGSAHDWFYISASPILPYTTFSSFNVTHMLMGDGSDDVNYWVELTQIVFNTSDPATTAYIKSAALPTLNGAITQIQLTTYGLSLASGASATFDLDINGDGTYELTSQALNSWIASAQTLAGAKVRLVFAKGTSTAASSSKGWVIQVV